MFFLYGLKSTLHDVLLLLLLLYYYYYYYYYFFNEMHPLFNFLQKLYFFQFPHLVFLSYSILCVGWFCNQFQEIQMTKTMLDQEITEANEDSFVRHGGNDVTWNRSWCALHFRLVFAFYILQNYHFRLQCSFFLINPLSLIRLSYFN